MKTQLNKSMPHVPLQKLKPEHQEQSTQHHDEIIDDFNDVGDQDNNDSPVNVFENTETAEDTTATFQYARQDAANNAETLGAASQKTEFAHKIFRKLLVGHRNKHEGESSENDVQLTNYGENSDTETESVLCAEHKDFETPCSWGSLLPRN